MRNPSLLPALAGTAAVAVALLAASPARADGVEYAGLGDTITGTTVPGVKEVIPFHVPEGTLLDIDLRMAPGSNPGFSILNPDRSDFGNLSAWSRSDARLGRRTAKKIPLVQSGRHYLLIQPATPGAYTLKIKGKQPPKGAFTGVIIADPATEIAVGGVPGALLTVTIKAGKGSGLVPDLHFVRGPDGEDIDLGRAAKHSASDRTDAYKDIPMDLLGTYVLGVGTRDGLPGDVGIVQWKVRYPAVRAAKRTDADIVVDPLVDAASPPTGFDNLSYTGVSVSGDFIGPSPAVRLEGPGGVIQGTNVIRAGDTALFFDVDLVGKTVGVYDLVVTLPNGAEGRRVGGFTVAETPLPATLAPPQAFDNQNRAATLSGSRFKPGMSVVLVPQSGGAGIAAVVGTVNPGSADLTLPLQDAPLGPYDVVATNPDGGTNTAAGVFTVLRAPRLTAAAPLLGHDNDAARAVALTGLSFQTGMTCHLERTGQSPIAGPLSALTATSATATFDLRGAAGGAWTLRVTNPDGGTALLTAPFIVSRAPRVHAVSPARGFDTESLTGVTVAGTDFAAGAQATLERAGSTTAPFTSEVVTLPAGTTLTGDVSLVGLAAGPHDLRVTNADAGTNLLESAMRVLGTTTLAGGHASAGRPSVAYNPDRAEYFAVYAVSDGTQRDVRGRRYDVVTGAALGEEVVLTTGSADQFDPSVAWSPYLAKYLVVYTHYDGSAEADRLRARGQFVDGDGTLNTDEENAYPLGAAVDGTASPPRVAWNPDRREWMVVMSFNRGGIYAVVLDEGQVFGGALVPGEVFRGLIVATTRTVGEGTVQDWEYDPDVAYASGATDYLVSYSFDVQEVAAGAGQTPPADTGIDVRAAVFDANFSSGANRLALLTNLGDTANRDETAARTAYSAATNRYLVAWVYNDGSGGRDVRGYLVDASSRARVGSSVTAFDGTLADVCTEVSVAFDATGGNNAWLVAYAVNAGTASTSRIGLTRVPPSGATSGLGTASSRTLAGTLSGQAFQGPDVAARSSAGEFVAVWRTTGTAKPGVNAEIRPAK